MISSLVTRNLFFISMGVFTKEVIEVVSDISIFQFFQLESLRVLLTKVIEKAKRIKIIH